MPLSTQLVGKDRKILELDNGGFTTGRVGYMPSVAVEHHHIHEGIHYTCNDYDNDVDTAEKEWLVKAPATGRIHVTFEMVASKNGVIEAFEGPTTSANGTGLTCYNSDRNSANTATLLVFKDPTVSVDGNRLGVVVIGSDVVAPTGARGGRTTRGQELILGVSTNYLLKFTALGNDTRVSMNLEFYEVT